MASKFHLTTRRGFVTAMGFGGVSLYALWVAYGAAPGPLSLLGLHDAHGKGEDKGTGDGGSGHGAPVEGPTTDEFRQMTAAFVERYRVSDGVIYPRLLPLGTPHERMIAADIPAEMGQASAIAKGGSGADRIAGRPTSDHDAHGGHGAGSADASQHAGIHEDGVRDVYLLAEKWSYEPAHLRLDAGVPYRFRMMAADVSHGASIQFGRGGRMIRLRPNAETAREMTFTKPGNYLIYCTIYCGEGHDRMQARIEVVRPGETNS